MTSSVRNTLLVALLAAALGHGSARMMMRPSRDEEILRELEHHAARADALAVKLGDIQAQLRDLQARPPVLSAPAMPSLPVAPVSAAAAPCTLERPAPPPVAPPPSPESLEALARGHQLLESAIAHRRWGPTEISELRQVMAGLNGPQRLEVLQALAAAINRGDIQGTLSSVLTE